MQSRPTTICRLVRGSDRAAAARVVASAVFNKAVALGVLGRSEDAIAVYDDLLARFGSATESPLRELVANALVNKGIMLSALGRSEDAIVVYDDLLARFNTATGSPLRELERSPKRSSTRGSRSARLAAAKRRSRPMTI